MSMFRKNSGQRSIESCTLRFGEQRNASNRVKIIKHSCALSYFVFTRYLYSLLTQTLHVRRVGKVTLTDTQACSYAFSLFIILLYIMF